MNRRGFTLIEVLVAGALFLATLSAFGLVLKSSAAYITRTQAKTKELYEIRSELERLNRLPFASLVAASSGETQITQLAADLCLVRVKTFYTLRSRY